MYLQVVGLNYSLATTPEVLLKTLDHCEYRKTLNGMVRSGLSRKIEFNSVCQVLSPVQLRVRLVHETNLTDMDDYGTHRVISFLSRSAEKLNRNCRTPDFPIPTKS